MDCVIYVSVVGNAVDGDLSVVAGYGRLCGICRGICGIRGGICGICRGICGICGGICGILITCGLQIAVAAVRCPVGITVRVEVDVISTVSINCTVITHAIRIPTGVAVPVVLLYFECITCGQANTHEHVLAGVAAVLAERIAIGNRPTVHGAH